jgi:hypothetical protein
MEYVKLFYGGMFQAIEDGRAFLAAFDFRPDGMNMRLQFQVGAETKTNVILRDQKPTALEKMRALPAGLMTYTGSQISGDLLKSMLPFTYGAFGGEGDSKTQLDSALKQLIAAGITGSFTATNVPPAGLQVQTFDDPVKGVAATLALFRAMGNEGTFQNSHIKGKPEIKENAETYQGFKFNFVHVTWDLDKFSETIPGGGDAAKAAMKRLIGEDIRLWFGTDGKRVVSVTAKDWNAARQQLDAFLSGSATLADDPAFATTRKNLPAESTMLMLADAGRFTQAMGDYMLSLFKAIPGLQFNLPDGIKPVPTKTSYLGFAITLRPENAGLDMFVPIVGVQEMRKVLMPLFMGGAQ